MFGWTAVFADEVVKIGRDNPKVVGVTAAMLEPVGLQKFALEFPPSYFLMSVLLRLLLLLFVPVYLSWGIIRFLLCILRF